MDGNRVSVFILLQNDIDEACGDEDEDEDFQPVLKPYQLVGVNFLLLLYRKGIGGGNSSVSLYLRFYYILVSKITLTLFTIIEAD